MLRKEPPADLSKVFSQLLDAQLGQQAYERGDFAEAASCFAQAATNRPRPEDVPLMYLLLARAQLQLHDRERAEAALERALRCRPALDPWYLSAGVFYAAVDAGRRGDTDAQRLAYTVLLSTLDHSEFAYTAACNLGALHYRQGREGEARRLWERVMAEGPAADQVTAAHNLSCYWRDRGDHHQADRYAAIEAERRSAAPNRRTGAPRRGLRALWSRLCGGGKGRATR